MATSKSSVVVSRQFTVTVSRLSTDQQGSSYVPVLNIDLRDPHESAALQTFSDLKRRFPVVDGFLLELMRRDVSSVILASQP